MVFYMIDDDFSHSLSYKYPPYTYCLSNNYMSDNTLKVIGMQQYLAILGIFVV